MNIGAAAEAEQPALLFWTSTARPYSIVKGLYLSYALKALIKPSG